MKFFFPDINVWIALAYDGHQHHRAAASSWFAGLNVESHIFAASLSWGF